MPSAIESPSDRVPKKAPRWDLTGTETCGSEKEFLVCPLVYKEYLGIYRAEIRFRGAMGGPQAHRGRLVSLWLSHGPFGLLPKLPRCLLVQEKLSKSFILFGLRLVLIFCRRQKQGKNSN